MQLADVGISAPVVNRGTGAEARIGWRRSEEAAALRSKPCFLLADAVNTETLSTHVSLVPAGATYVCMDPVAVGPACSSTSWKGRTGSEASSACTPAADGW